VRNRIKVSEEDMQHHYKTHPAAFGGEEELHVGHLFLPLAEDAPPQAVRAAEAEAARIRERLRAGEDFAALARQHSAGPAAEHGGDLGWLRRGGIQKALEDAFVGLADGEISQPVRLGPGLHLFKVVERRRAGGKSYEQAKEEIRELLFQDQSSSYRDQYLAELRRDASIDVRLPELREALPAAPARAAPLRTAEGRSASPSRSAIPPASARRSRPARSSRSAARSSRSCAATPGCSTAAWRGSASRSSSPGSPSRPAAPWWR
jgi:hypothetical protein